jgi:hypothetical protein
LLVLNLELSWNLLYLSLGSIGLGVILFLPLIKTIKSIAPRKEKIKINSNNNSELLGFLLTYIIPFCVAFTTLNSIIAFGILILMIFIIYIDTSLFSVNPLLKIILRYNIYEIKYNNKRYFLLSKNKYFDEEVLINVKQLDSEVLIEE